MTPVAPLLVPGVLAARYLAALTTFDWLVLALYGLIVFAIGAWALRRQKSGEDCDLKRYGERLASSGGKRGKKRAVVAVARKLAVLMHHMLLDDTPYDPLKNSRAKGRMAS